jgi:hypothetical protein
MTIPEEIQSGHKKIHLVRKITQIERENKKVFVVVWEGEQKIDVNTFHFVLLLLLQKNS